jgi:RNA polymerase sigma-70 factor (ECF subfamily)
MCAPTEFSCIKTWIEAIPVKKADKSHSSPGSDPTAAIRDLSILWLAAQPIVGGFIASQIGDFNESQDVLQEVAMDVVKNFEHYDPSKPFLPWAIGIARYKIADFYRMNNFDRLVFDDAVIECIAVECEKLGSGSLVIQEALEHCLKRVEGRSRTMLDLRYRDGLSSAEIAGRLVGTITAVDTSLHRIRLALRKCILHRMDSGRLAT